MCLHVLTGAVGAAAKQRELSQRGVPIGSATTASALKPGPQASRCLLNIHSPPPLPSQIVTSII